FLQYWFPGRNATNMSLACHNGELTGTGRDWVGSYNIAGSYDLGTGRCEWTKRYLGKHSVAYRGVNDGHGIWGVWEIRQLGGLFTDRGGFHVWPEGTDVSEESAQTERAVLAMMRQEFGSRLVRTAPWLIAVAAAVATALLVWWRHSS